MKNHIRAWLGLPALEETIDARTAPLWNELRALGARLSQTEALAAAHGEALKAAELRDAGRIQCSKCGRVVPTYSAEGNLCAACGRVA